MRFILFVLFIVMPFVELALLIKLGNVLGFWPTIGVVLFSAVVGAYVLQSQGVATMRRISQSMMSSEPPIKPMVDGFFLVISGAFLITPGIITDAAGLMLFIPAVRHAVARWVFGRILKGGAFTIHTYTTGGGPSGSHSKPQDSNQPEVASPAPQHRKAGRKPGSDSQVVDAEFEEIKKKN